MTRIVLGVTGGIAAYKACELLRRLQGAGYDVTVVPTVSALKFVGTTTWEALSGHPVHTEVFDDACHIPHVALGQRADLVMVAPATADLLSRAATGRADDLLTNVLLTAHCPVVFAPAMHTEMWLHPATQTNVATLRERGVVVLHPDSGRLTGADSGAGRLPEPAELLAVAQTILSEPTLTDALAHQDLTGLRIAISAGGTREHLDPVRFIGNSSSGLMGWALARAASLRGAEVTLVAANVEATPPVEVAPIPVTSTAELGEAMTTAAVDADIVIMAAAPADYTPTTPSGTKIKKSGSDGLEVSLTQTADVLAGLVTGRADPSQVIVGFAAETPTADQSLVELGRAKLKRKGCDLLVLNAVGPGVVFGQPNSEIIIMGADTVGSPLSGSKDLLAHHILNAALARRDSQKD